MSVGLSGHRKHLRLRLLLLLAEGPSGCWYRFISVVLIFQQVYEELVNSQVLIMLVFVADEPELGRSADPGEREAGEAPAAGLCG